MLNFVESYVLVWVEAPLWPHDVLIDVKHGGTYMVLKYAAYLKCIRKSFAQIEL